MTAMPDLQAAALRQELAAAGSVDDLELLRGVLASSGDCIKILDLDGRLQFMSEGGKLIMEVDDFSALKGCPWPDFWENPNNKDAIAAVEAAKLGKTSQFQGPANTAKGSPRYWNVRVSPIFDEDRKPAQILSISTDITDEWRASERQRFLTDELQHRVKNTLTLVNAIAAQTFKGEQYEAGRKAFAERTALLADSYDLLSATEWPSAAMRDVIDMALRPHLREAGNVTFEGPPINLGPRQALAFALAINELATNAIKYGALSVPAGQVAITWRTGQPGDKFEWAWQESGGPKVEASAPVGFGTRVIRDMLAGELKGDGELTLDPAGLRFTLIAPRAELASA